MLSHLKFYWILLQSVNWRQEMNFLFSFPWPLVAAQVLFEIQQTTRSIAVTPESLLRPKQFLRAEQLQLIVGRPHSFKGGRRVWTISVTAGIPMGGRYTSTFENINLGELSWNRELSTPWFCNERLWAQKISFMHPLISRKHCCPQSSARGRPLSYPHQKLRSAWFLWL